MRGGAVAWTVGRVAAWDAHMPLGRLWPRYAGRARACPSSRPDCRPRCVAVALGACVTNATPAHAQLGREAGL